MESTEATQCHRRTISGTAVCTLRSCASTGLGGGDSTLAYIGTFARTGIAPGAKSAQVSFAPDMSELLGEGKRPMSGVGGPTPSLGTRSIPRSELLSLSDSDPRVEATRQRLDALARREPPAIGGLGI